MVDILYAVMAFTCALVAILLPVRTRRSLSDRPIDKAFIALTDWTAVFCLADAAWGVIASELIISDGLLVAASFVFHLFASFTPLVWLHFVVVYLGDVKHRKLYGFAALAIFAAEFFLIVLNFSNNGIFYVAEDHTYHSGPLRKYLFYAQYANYVAMSVLALFRITRSKLSRSSNIAVLAFVSAPILLGIFQQLAPDAPAYSIGYMLGCCLIYSFVVAEMLEDRIRESQAMSIANEAKTTFLFSMSHDLRTPMNAILGFTDIALRHSEDHDQVINSLHKIKGSGSHLLNLINDILEMSRIEAGKLELTNDALDLRSAIENAGHMGQTLALKKSIDFTVSTVGLDNPYVFADELHLNEIIINIISNAIKYTPEGGKVSYVVEQTTKETGGFAMYRFTVTDSGIGMSDDFQKHLFESFSRERTSSVSKIEGTGLGLPIVKRIVDMAGGRIDIRSRQGAGTTVTVELPFVVMDEDAIKLFHDQGNSEDESIYDVALAGKRTLLVEDNELNREIATMILTEAGLEVETAEDGSLAVDAISSKGADYYDFVLMDIQMPVMNGFEATSAIRKLPGGDRIPIIALSANAFEEDKKKSLDSGMDGHIAKPIDVQELLDTMKILS